MQPTKWLEENDANLINDLAKLVAVQSISTDGAHQKELDDCAELTCTLMKSAGLNNVAVLKTGNSNPYAYGEWLGAPGKPTVFLYAHHDVQPVMGFEDKWHSPPFTLTERDGRLLLHDGAVVAVTRASMLRGRERPDDPHAFFGIDRRGFETGIGETVEIDSPRDLYWAEAVLREGTQGSPRRHGEHGEDGRIG